MTPTSARELVDVCYVDLVLRWEILVPGMFVGYFLCQGLCSLRFSNRLVQCYVVAAAYLCAAVATAVFIDAAMISARPTGYRWCVVVNHLAVPLFQRTFITSAVIVLAGASLGLMVQCAFHVIGPVVDGVFSARALDRTRHQSHGRSQRNL
ncbi:hypothetical protein psal_cds_762 [Pandoravirus salinus]|uniref:Uncharacterized protein n=1 Tax=Pandoravirus salinus TaxID=1349410 RepID=S4W2L1_9VIRU|nr:hypothetical protein psal_cds_762 [Pandoravirus salinus]AGO84757.1 hypothetical protein psal_cds_762 [Pandoravirus salinus]